MFIKVLRPAVNHGSCNHYLGPDICFYKYKYHDSLQARLIEGIGHYEQFSNDHLFPFEVSYQL